MTDKDTKNMDMSDKETEETQNSGESVEETQEESAQEALEQEAQETSQEPEEGVDTDYKELYDAQVDKYTRLMAEFENFKRRTAREYERMVQSASEKLMKELVEVREGFERAISQENKDGDFEKFFEGVKMLFNRFDKILGDNGLESFGEPGDKFDPDLHDAMMNTPHPEIEEGRIASIYERGYILNGKVMKHAKVLISSGKPEGEENTSDDSQKEEGSENQEED